MHTHSESVVDSPIKTPACSIGLFKTRKLVHLFRTYLLHAPQLTALLHTECYLYIKIFKLVSRYHFESYVH